MFINTPAFKKMLAGAYKHQNLIVGNEGDEYIFSDGTWIIRVYKDMLTNKEKAAVIEVIGEFPGQDKILKMGKDMYSQYMLSNNAFDIRNIFDKCQYEMTVTKAVYQMPSYDARAVQYRKNQECFFINNYFINIFGQKSDDDSIPEGPKALNENRGTLYWKNNTMAFAVYPVAVNEDDSEYREHLALLSNIILPEAKYL